MNSLIDRLAGAGRFVAAAAAIALEVVLILQSASLAAMLGDTGAALMAMCVGVGGMVLTALWLSERGHRMALQRRLDDAYRRHDEEVKTLVGLSRRFSTINQKIKDMT